MSEHTPGPWRVHVSRTDDLEYVVTNEGHKVAFPYGHNARLIAAAPDLLEAAKHAEEILSLYVAQTGEPGEALEALRIAITKAVGTDA